MGKQKKRITADSLADQLAAEGTFLEDTVNDLTAALKDAQKRAQDAYARSGAVAAAARPDDDSSDSDYAAGEDFGLLSMSGGRTSTANFITAVGHELNLLVVKAEEEKAFAQELALTMSTAAMSRAGDDSDDDDDFDDDDAFDPVVDAQTAEGRFRVFAAAFRAVQARLSNKDNARRVARIIKALQKEIDTNPTGLQSAYPDYDSALKNLQKQAGEGTPLARAIDDIFTFDIAATSTYIDPSNAAPKAVSEPLQQVQAAIASMLQMAKALQKQNRINEAEAIRKRARSLRKGMRQAVANVTSTVDHEAAALKAMRTGLDVKGEKKKKFFDKRNVDPKVNDKHVTPIHYTAAFNEITKLMQDTEARIQAYLAKNKHLSDSEIKYLREYCLPHIREGKAIPEEFARSPFAVTYNEKRETILRARYKHIQKSIKRMVHHAWLVKAFPFMKDIMFNAGWKNSRVGDNTYDILRAVIRLADADLDTLKLFIGEGDLFEQTNLAAFDNATEQHRKRVYFGRKPGDLSAEELEQALSCFFIDVGQLPEIVDKLTPADHPDAEKHRGIAEFLKRCVNRTARHCGIHKKVKRTEDAHGNVNFTVEDARGAYVEEIKRRRWKYANQFFTWFAHKLVGLGQGVLAAFGTSTLVLVYTAEGTLAGANLGLAALFSGGIFGGALLSAAFWPLLFVVLPIGLPFLLFALGKLLPEIDLPGCKKAGRFFDKIAPVVTTVLWLGLIGLAILALGTANIFLLPILFIATPLVLWAIGRSNTRVGRIFKKITPAMTVLFWFALAVSAIFILGAVSPLLAALIIVAGSLIFSSVANSNLLKVAIYNAIKDFIIDGTPWNPPFIQNLKLLEKQTGKSYRGRIRLIQGMIFLAFACSALITAITAKAAFLSLIPLLITVGVISNPLGISIFFAFVVVLSLIAFTAIFYRGVIKLSDLLLNPASDKRIHFAAYLNPEGKGKKFENRFANPLLMLLILGTCTVFGLGLMSMLAPLFASAAFGGGFIVPAFVVGAGAFLIALAGGPVLFGIIIGALLLGLCFIVVAKNLKWKGDDWQHLTKTAKAGRIFAKFVKSFVLSFMLCFALLATVAGLLMWTASLVIIVGSIAAVIAAALAVSILVIFNVRDLYNIFDSWTDSFVKLFEKSTSRVPTTTLTQSMDKKQIKIEMLKMKQHHQQEYENPEYTTLTLDNMKAGNVATVMKHLNQSKNATGMGTTVEHLVLKGLNTDAVAVVNRDLAQSSRTTTLTLDGLDKDAVKALNFDADSNPHLQHLHLRNLGENAAREVLSRLNTRGETYNIETLSLDAETYTHLFDQFDGHKNLSIKTLHLVDVKNEHLNLQKRSEWTDFPAHIETLVLENSYPSAATWKRLNNELRGGNNYQLKTVVFDNPKKTSYFGKSVRALFAMQEQRARDGKPLLEIQFKNLSKAACDKLNAIFEERGSDSFSNGFRIQLNNFETSKHRRVAHTAKKAGLFVSSPSGKPGTRWGGFGWLRRAFDWIRHAWKTPSREVDTVTHDMKASFNLLCVPLNGVGNAGTMINGQYLASSENGEIFIAENLASDGPNLGEALLLVGQVFPIFDREKAETVRGQWDKAATTAVEAHIEATAPTSGLRGSYDELDDAHAEDSTAVMQEKLQAQAQQLQKKPARLASAMQPKSSCCKSSLFGCGKSSDSELDIDADDVRAATAASAARDRSGFFDEASSSVRRGAREHGDERTRSAPVFRRPTAENHTGYTSNSWHGRSGKKGKGRTAPRGRGAAEPLMGSGTNLFGTGTDRRRDGSHKKGQRQRVRGDDGAGRDVLGPMRREANTGRKQRGDGPRRRPTEHTLNSSSGNESSSSSSGTGLR